MLAHICACIWSPETNAGCLPQVFSSLIERNFSLDLKLANPARLASQQAPGVLLFLPSQS